MKNCKKKTKYILSILLGLLLTSSCTKDFLNRNDPGAINSSDVWNDEILINLYINKIYNERPGWDRKLYNNISDESRDNNPANESNKILLGQWDEVNNPMSNWSAAYASIRRMNEFFVKIGSSPLSKEQQNILSSEVYFLRAFMYFDLVKRYGGVPLLNDVQFIDEDLSIARGSVDETFQFILKDLDKALAFLPAKAPKAKASKSAALALKGRVLLYWASPLYNPNNDMSRWEAAAEVNKMLIDQNQYSLFNDLSTLWLNDANKEAIYQVEYHMPEKSHGWDAAVKPLVFANNDAGHASPLQKLVDGFPMANGKNISEAGSGYDPQNPYVNRDKRFYSFIAYNGAKMKGTTSGPPVREITLEIYQGGRDLDGNPATVVYNTLTGYYTVKAVNPENNIYKLDNGSTQPWIELRYAEVLLNYAEARNEQLGPDQSICDALNLIRARAGITTQLVPGAFNKEEMRKFIQNERFVELCFEGKRYWDLKRWKVAHLILNGSKGRGVVPRKTVNGFEYQYLDVDPQPNIFSEKMYFMPIPRSEITKNSKLKQNPGWDK